MNQKRQVKRRGKRMLSGALSFILALSMIFMALPAMRAEAKDYENYKTIENCASGETITLTRDEKINRNQSNQTVMVYLKRSCTLDGQGHSFTGFTGNEGSAGNFLYDYGSKTFNLTNITLVNNNCRILNPRSDGTVFNADSSVVFKTNGSPSVWSGGLAEIGGGGATLNLNGSAVNGVRSNHNHSGFYRYAP